MGKVTPIERAPAAEISAVHQLQETYGDLLVLVEARKAPDGQVSLIAIVDSDKQTEGSSVPPEFDGKPISILDRATYNNLLQLEAAGIVAFVAPATTVLYESEKPDPKAQRQQKRLSAARGLLTAADRKFQMATLLAGGHFLDEAYAHASAIVALAYAFVEKLDESQAKTAVGLG